MKEFINITVSIPEEYFEFAVAALMDFTILGITEEFDKLIICFNNDIWNDEVKSEMLSALSDVYHDVKIENEEIIFLQNWNEEWEKNVPVINVSERIDITPEWKKNESNAQIKVIINPKMSFGTGQHETTRLISKLMEKFVKENQFWIDAGTGTGVLGILAAKLGAKSVFAFDNNSWSTENAIENVQLNKVEDIVVVEELDIDDIDLPQADGIAANLYANLVISSIPKFFNALKNSNGHLLVSGILVYDKDDVIEAAKNEGFEFLEILQEAEWVSIAFRA